MFVKKRLFDDVQKPTLPKPHFLGLMNLGRRVVDADIRALLREDRAHLERLQDDVSRNQSMLQEMRRRGCVRRECVFLFVVLGVALWLYVVHALTLE